MINTCAQSQYGRVHNSWARKNEAVAMANQIATSAVANIAFLRLS